MEEKIPLSLEIVYFQMLDFEISNSKSEVSKSNVLKIYFFLENTVSSEGAISHSVLHYQPLPITHYQVRFYANILVST